MSKRAVRLWEDRIRLETVELSEHNRHPQFEDVYGTWAFPYPVADLVGDRRRRKKSYLAVHIENEYLRVTTFPHFGGRIYSCHDKASGCDIFHPVERVGFVFMPGGTAGGTYAACGVEMSFPDHHSLTNTRKREYLTLKHPDGSAEIVMGELDLRHRLRWEVHLRLFPGVAALFQEMRVFNRTLFPARGRYWGNASMPCESPRFECIYPEKEGWEHGGEFGVASWPIYDAVDMRYPKDVPIAVGVESKDVRDGFYAFYDHDKSFGMVHWSPADECPGKKYWTWGSSQHALHRAQSYGDDKIYLEMQSGRNEDQEDFDIYQPLCFARWREVWYPIRNTGGVCAGSAAVALNLSIEKRRGKLSGCHLGLWPTKRLPGAKVTVTDEASGKVLASAGVNLSPQRCRGVDLRFADPAAADASLRVVVEQDGKAVLDYLYEKPAYYDNAADRACTSPETKRIETGDDALVEAESQMLYQRRPWSQAERLMEEVLKKDPNHTEGHRWLAVLLSRRGLHEKAAEHAEAAVARRPRDPLAHFYLALARLAMGNDREGRWHLLLAARHGQEDAAYYILGRLAMKAGDWSEAEELFGQSLEDNAKNLLSRVYRALALWRLRRKREALAELDDVLRRFPSEAFGRVARVLVSAGTLKGLFGAAQGKRLSTQLRQDVQSYLEIAFDFAAVGFYAEAMAFLGEVKRECRTSPGLGLMDYCRGWLLHEMGKSGLARKAFAAGAKADRAYAFPFRLEEEGIFKTALKYNSRDAVAWYYLAILRGGQARFEEAAEAWERAMKLGLKDPVACLGLGKITEVIFKDPEAAVKPLETGLKIDENDTHIRAALINLAKRRRDGRTLKKLFDHPSVEKSHLIFQLAQFQLDTGRLDDAVETITERAQFPNMAQEQEALHEEILVTRAVRYLSEGKLEAALADLDRAMTRPKNLGYTVKMRCVQPRVRYFRGLVLRRLGREKQAVEEWEKGISEQEFRLWMRGLGWDYGIWIGRYFQALMLQELGRDAQAEVYFDAMREHAMSKIVSGIGEAQRRKLFELARRGKAKKPITEISTSTDYLGLE